VFSYEGALIAAVAWKYLFEDSPAQLNPKTVFYGDFIFLSGFIPSMN